VCAMPRSSDSRLPPRSPTPTSAILGCPTILVPAPVIPSIGAPIHVSCPILALPSAPRIPPLS
jgi:hypothetical protein